MLKIDGELPWGCWFRVEEKGSNRALVVINEESGEEWRSIREAFWVGRLGMPLERNEVPHQKLEHLNAVLASVARGTMGRRETAVDLFGGSFSYCDWYFDWLAAEDLIDTSSGPVRLSDEGSAALLMLNVTRPTAVNRERPSAATVRQLTELAMGPEEREERLVRAEEAAKRWDVAFLRRHIGGRFMIILSQRGRGAMPVMKTVWSLSFQNEDQRDTFYEWLCLRVDRWPAWADLAHAEQAPELTHRLLQMLASELKAPTTLSQSW